MTRPEHSRTHGEALYRLLVASLVLFASLAWLGCRGEPKPRNIDTVDVTPGIEIDTSGDQQAKPPKAGLVGILPKDFPGDLPIYIPASLVDFGESARGRPTVSLLSPHGVSRVRRELYAKLRARGWQASSGSDGTVVLRKGREQAWLRIEEGRPGTLYHFEY